jgi:hypothetical protein
MCKSKTGKALASPVSFNALGEVSEVEAAGKLKPSHLVTRSEASDPTCVRIDDVGVRITEICVIEYVKEIAAEGELESLRDREGFGG